MKALRAPLSAGLLGVLLAATSPALADERTCAPMVVALDDRVAERWPDLASEVCTAFQTRDGVDRCARVELALNGAGIRVDVTLPDGRSAVRFVSERDDVLATLEALLFVPELRTPGGTCALQPSTTEPAETSTQSSASPEAPPAPRSRAKRPSPSRRRTARMRPSDTAAGGEAEAADEASGLGIELSLLTRAGVGSGQLRAGAGALTLLDISGWLVGFEARADAYAVTSDEPHGAFTLALLGGHRLRARPWVLDLIAGPALALRGGSQADTAATSGNPPELRRVEVPETSTGVSPRLIVGAHVGYGARAGSRVVMGLEGEFGREYSERTVGPGSMPQLPSWSVCLALGASLGTR